MTRAQQLSCPDGHTLAFHKRDGAAPALVWFGGFKSDMTGTKATAVEAWAQMRGHACVRFDYFGHGASSGRFEDGTIGRWLEDGMQVLREVVPGPVVLVGSSMGAWLSLLAARALRQSGDAGRLKAMVLIAPAPDFTETLMWERFSDDIRRQITVEGAYRQPSAYDEAPYVITRQLIDDGRAHLMMDTPIPVTCPVRILQGMRDEDVPWPHALKLMDAITGDDVLFTLVKSGDHRLSTQADIARLYAALDEVTGHEMGHMRCP